MTWILSLILLHVWILNIDVRTMFLMGYRISLSWAKKAMMEQIKMKC